MTPVNRSSLHEQVVQHLKQMIVEGRITAGAKLNEKALCEQLAISRTPLREAIKRLASEGLVVLLPNRGAIAAELTEADVQATFEVIAGLEAQAGSLAAARIQPDELAQVRALHHDMVAAYDSGDLPGYYALNARIHQAINAAARNPVLALVYNQVNSRVQALRFRSNLDKVKWRRAIDEHAEMLEALAAGDGPRMARIMTLHLNNKRDAVLDQMREARAAQADERGG